MVKKAWKNDKPDSVHLLQGYWNRPATIHLGEVSPLPSSDIATFLAREMGKSRFLASDRVCHVLDRSRYSQHHMLAFQSPREVALSATYFLLHFPWPYGPQYFTGILSSKVRTFLSPDDAVAPSGQRLPVFPRTEAM